MWRVVKEQTTTTKKQKRETDENRCTDYIFAKQKDRPTYGVSIAKLRKKIPISPSVYTGNISSTGTDNGGTEIERKEIALVQFLLLLVNTHWQYSIAFTIHRTGKVFDKRNLIKCSVDNELHFRCNIKKTSRNRY